MKPDYKKVIKFLKRVKPSEQKVLNALKIFDNTEVIGIVQLRDKDVLRHKLVKKILAKYN